MKTRTILLLCILPIIIVILTTFYLLSAPKSKKQSTYEKEALSFYNNFMIARNSGISHPSIKVNLHGAEYLVYFTGYMGESGSRELGLSTETAREISKISGNGESNQGLSWINKNGNIEFYIYFRKIREITGFIFRYPPKIWKNNGDDTVEVVLDNANNDWK